jgi:hypothetical protein
MDLGGGMEMSLSSGGLVVPELIGRISSLGVCPGVSIGDISSAMG